jgi:hypothetical protein
MESNDNNNREEHQNARKRKFQEHPQQANGQPEEEQNDFEVCLIIDTIFVWKGKL